MPIEKPLTVSFFILERELADELGVAFRGMKNGKRPLMSMDFGSTPSEETKRKISQSHMGLRPSKETLLKMSASKMGKKRGRENPTYDHKVREFYKDNGDIFIGTRADFIDTFLLRPGCVSSMITGKQRSVKGWRLR